MSDSNRVQLSIIRQASKGEVLSNPNWNILRNTGQPGLGGNPVTVISNELVSTRRVKDVSLVGKEAGGGTNIELSYDTYKDIMSGVLYNTWVDQVDVTNTASTVPMQSMSSSVISADVGTFDNFTVGDIVQLSGFTDPANNGVVGDITNIGVSGETMTINATLVDDAAIQLGARVKKVGYLFPAGDLSIDATAKTLTAATEDFIARGLTVGDWFKLGGEGASFRFPTEANNGWYRIASLTGSVITWDMAPEGVTTESTTVETVKMWIGSYLIDGVDPQWFQVERQFQDHSPVTFERIPDAQIDSLQLVFNTQSIVTGTIQFMGLDQVFGEIPGSTYNPANANQVLNTSSNVGRIAENGIPLGDSDKNFVMSTTLTYGNSLRRKNAVGYLPSIGIGADRYAIECALDTYFDDDSKLQKVLTNERTSYDLRMETDLSQAIVFDFPKAKYSSGNVEVPGIDTDVNLPLVLTALEDLDKGYEVKIMAFDYFEN